MEMITTKKKKKGQRGWKIHLWSQRTLILLGKRGNEDLQIIKFLEIQPPDAMIDVLRPPL